MDNDGKAPHRSTKHALMVALVTTILTTWALLVIYRATFNRLNHIPGPFLARLSNYSYSKAFLGGYQPFHILSLHEKYGKVVRTAPNDVSFASPASWDAIYKPREGQPPFPKSRFYEYGIFAGKALSVTSERDNSKHREIRHLLADVFSERSLKASEPLISRVVDLFIETIGKDCNAVIDLTKWFNILTFDIIGELAFGESFGGIETGNLHPWASFVLESMKEFTWVDTMMRFPMIGTLFVLGNPFWARKLLKGAQAHRNHALSMVKKRQQCQPGRKDFLTNLLKQEIRQQYKLTDIQLAAYSSDFIIAGSETTATALATIVWYVAKSNTILSKLQEEIRQAHKCFSDITILSTSKLPYMHAVCLEAMRIFPPLPLGLPRTVPKGGAVIEGFYIPAGTTVSTNPFAANKLFENFKDPWEFKPERWLESNNTDQLNASRPFSMGPRACIGRNLAWIELHLIVAKFYFKFNPILLDNKMDWQRDSKMHLLWAKPELFVRLESAVMCKKDPVIS